MDIYKQLTLAYLIYEHMDSLIPLTKIIYDIGVMGITFAINYYNIPKICNICQFNKKNGIEIIQCNHIN